MGGFLLCISAILLLLILIPIRLRFDVFFDVSSGKVGATLHLFSKIKLLGGYITPCSGGCAYHISERRAILFTYRQMQQGQKQFFEKSSIRLTKVQTVFEIGVEYLFFVKMVENFIKYLDFFSKPLQEYETKIVLKGCDCFRLFLRLEFRWGILQQLTFMIKNLIKGAKQCRKKKLAV